jgi:hypothetical protein
MNKRKGFIIRVEKAYFQCNNCKYKTISRENIRKHVQEVHKFRGVKKGTTGKQKTPSEVTCEYKRIEQ